MRSTSVGRIFDNGIDLVIYLVLNLMFYKLYQKCLEIQAVLEYNNIKYNEH